MKYFIISILTILFYCFYVNSCSFDRESWVKNNDVNQFGIQRQLMINDLVKNILKKGMTKSEVIELLGKPYSDRIHYRLPKDKIISDSISTIIGTVDSKEKGFMKDSIRNWESVIRQPYTILRYPAGFSLVDQNFLSIEFHGNTLVKDFHVEQH